MFFDFFKSGHWHEKAACIRTGYILNTSLSDDIQICNWEPNPWTVELHV